MTVVTRFAPSPTGFLHIGGARTALFNYLFARHHGGEFRLRIEDTDQARNVPGATDAIFEGMKWLGLDYDGAIAFQSLNEPRHREVAHAMLENGTAYLDYTTKAEMEAMRADWQATNPKAPFRYRSPYRDGASIGPVTGEPPVVRLAAPRTGTTVIDDLVQGRVEVQNNELDDMVLLRGDGTPTYMLAVVVDDYDAGVTHVIRGDDHLNNAFRQLPIYHAMGWSTPVYAHIPLIHGEDGKKLSKRHAALGVMDYDALGVLPDAMFNYLLRLGWGHGDDEIISREQAREWFDIADVGRGPSRFDLKKLMSTNAHYLRAMSADEATEAIFRGVGIVPTPRRALMISKAVPGLLLRATNLVSLAEMARFYITPPDVKLEPGTTIPVDVLMTGEWTAPNIEERMREYAERTGEKLKNIMAPLRLAITGEKNSPPLFEAMELLGRDEIHRRVLAAIND